MLAPWDRSHRTVTSATNKFEPLHPRSPQTFVLTPSFLDPPSKTGFIVKRVYENFVEKAVDETLTRCRDDLTALTRFVTWDLHERSAGALRRSLPDSSMVHIYSMAVRGLVVEHRV